MTTQVAASTESGLEPPGENPAGFWVLLCANLVDFILISPAIEFRASPSLRDCDTDQGRDACERLYVS